MCGIVGFIGEGSSEDLKKMVSTLDHRGPDGKGYFIDEKLKVFLGHTRLSIIDIKYGSQPMSDSNLGINLIFNGEIYNHKILRALLEKKGYKFYTKK